jgi:hypothetical protein
MFSPRRKTHRYFPSLGTKAVAAVEFAIIISFFMVVFIGSFEILTLLRTSQKLNALVGSVAESVTSISPSGAALSSTALQDVCFGAADTLLPLAANGLTVDIASVTTTTAGTKVDYWEQDFTGASCTAVATPVIGSATACNLATNNNAGGLLPAANGAIGDNAIIVRATLTYPGLVGLWLKSAPTYTQQVLTRWSYATTSNELKVTGVTPTSMSCTG